MVREEEFTAIVERCRKIMGPVAQSLAQEAAKEVGAKVDGEKVMIANDAQFGSLVAIYKAKLAKIIGQPLADSLVK